MTSELNLDLPAPTGSSPAGAVTAPQSEPSDARASRRAAEKSASPGASESPHAKNSEVVKLLGARDSSQDRLVVSIDKKAGVIVRIVDEGGNVVRQIPPDELIELAKRLDEMIGLLFDKKA